VGEESVGLGLKFRARVVLDIREHADGVPPTLLSNGHADERRLPEPRSPLARPTRDISFRLVEGDFQVRARAHA
jgi:hypothetical protein